MEEQIQQLRRKLSEQVLERAEADPRWRQQLIEDPDTALGGMPEARQLREMLESPNPTQQPPEFMSPPQEDQQLQRSLWEKVLDRAARDPQWKQQLIDDPDAAIREANFSEGQELQEMRKSAEASVEAEVHGHCVPGAGGPMYTQLYLTAGPNCCKFVTLDRYALSP